MSFLLCWTLDRMRTPAVSCNGRCDMIAHRNPIQGKVMLCSQILTHLRVYPTKTPDCLLPVGIACSTCSAWDKSLSQIWQRIFVWLSAADEKSANNCNIRFTARVQLPYWSDNKSSKPSVLFLSFYRLAQSENFL